MQRIRTLQPLSELRILSPTAESVPLRDDFSYLDLFLEWYNAVFIHLGSRAWKILHRVIHSLSLAFANSDHFPSIRCRQSRLKCLH